MNEIRSRLFRDGSGDGPLVVGAKRPKGASADAGLKSVTVPRQEGRTKDTRRSDRHRITQEFVTLRHRRKTHKVELINLSGGGAMVVGGAFAPRIWDVVELKLGPNGTVECAVRWVKGDRIGLEFAHETRIDCSPDERNAVLRNVLQRCFPTTAGKAAEPDELAAGAKRDSATNDAPHRRAEGRHPLIWSGVIHYDHDSHAVRLRNISATGAMIECATPLPVGAEPLLDLGEAGSLFATVTWTKGDQAGLAFQELFDIDRLARAKPKVAPQRWVKPAYLRDTGGSSPWDEHWQRLSIDELGAELDGFLKR